MGLSLLQEASDPRTPPERLRALSREGTKVACAVAKNPGCPPELLEELFSQKDPDISVVLAQNPNTPLKILFLLGERFPEEFLQNPIWPLLLLENPNLIAEMPPRTLASVLQMEDVPLRFLEGGAEHYEKEVQQAVIENPRVPPEALTRLSGSIYEGIRQRVAEHPKAPPEALARLVEDKSRWIRQLVAKNPSTSPSLLEKLSEDQDEEVRRAVARRRDTHPEILTRLATDRYSDVRRAVSQNPSTPQEILDLLTRAGSDATLCRKTSPDPSLPPEDLEKLAQGGYWARLLASRHPQAPPSLLTRLAEDPSSEVREALLHNPNTPREIRELLKNRV